jgi:hypothetical protein
MRYSLMRIVSRVRVPTGWRTAKRAPRLRRPSRLAGVVGEMNVMFRVPARNRRDEEALRLRS